MNKRAILLAAAALAFISSPAFADLNVKDATGASKFIKTDSHTCASGQACSYWMVVSDGTNAANISTSSGDAVSNTMNRLDVESANQVWDNGGTQWERMRGNLTGVGSTFTGMPNTLPMGIYHSSGQTLTDGQGSMIQLDANSKLLVNPGTVTVTGTVTSNLGTLNGVALDATLTGGSAVTQLKSGTKGTSSAALITSTASGSNHQPIDVAIFDASGNQITSFGGAGGTSSSIGSAVPSTATAAGFSDGTNLQLPRVFDGDSGAGTQYDAGVLLKTPGSGGAVDVGVSGNPLYVQFASAQAVSQSGSNWSTNVAQINGVTPLMGNGITGTGSQRVTIASDNTAFAVNATLQTGANVVGKVGIDQTTPGTTNAVQPIPATSGGLTLSSTISAASTNATSVKASAGQVYVISLQNTSASGRYVRFFNKASAPTVGTDTPVLRFYLPPTGGNNVPIPSVGLAFGTGIAFDITGAAADNDTTTVSASDVFVNIGYK